MSTDDSFGLMDMSGRRLREPVFPRITRQSPMQRTFLKRLQRLVMLSRYGQRHLAFSEEEDFLIRKSIYSIYRDCVDIGVLREAREILRAGSAR